MIVLQSPSAADATAMIMEALEQEKEKFDLVVNPFFSKAVRHFLNCGMISPVQEKYNARAHRSKTVTFKQTLRCIGVDAILNCRVGFQTH